MIWSRPKWEKIINLDASRCHGFVVTLVDDESAKDY